MEHDFFKLWNCSKKGTREYKMLEHSFGNWFRNEFLFVFHLPAIFWSEICDDSLFYLLNAFNNSSNSFTFSIFQQFIALYHFDDGIAFSWIQWCRCCFPSTPSTSKSSIRSMQKRNVKAITFEMWNLFQWTYDCTRYSNCWNHMQ